MIVNRWTSAAVTFGLVATTLLAGAAPGAAAADRPSRVVLRDGPGDVQRIVPPDTTSHPYGDFPPADVTRAVVDHRSGKVVIRMRFVDIKKAGRQLYWLDIRTGDHHEYRATLVSRAGARQGHRTFEVDGVATKCRGFTREIDYAKDLVTMRIARSCLANPTWVRVQILNTLEYKSGGPLYIDNPHNHKAMGGPTARLYRAS